MDYVRLNLDVISSLQLVQLVIVMYIVEVCVCFPLTKLLAGSFS